jgi:hypothetical protein
MAHPVQPLLPAAAAPPLAQARGVIRQLSARALADLQDRMRTGERVLKGQGLAPHAQNAQRVSLAALRVFAPPEPPRGLAVVAHWVVNQFSRARDWLGGELSLERLTAEQRTLLEGLAASEVEEIVAAERDRQIFLKELAEWQEWGSNDGVFGPTERAEFAAELTRLADDPFFPRNVVDLRIRGYSFRELPSALRHLTYLSNLILEDLPRLVELPDCFGDLFSLSDLSITNCRRLTYLPDLSGCPNLERLFLSACPLLRATPEDVPEGCAIVHPELQRHAEFPGDVIGRANLSDQVEILDLLRKALATTSAPNRALDDFASRALLPGTDPQSWEAQVLSSLDEQTDRYGLALKKDNFKKICQLIRSAPPATEFSRDPSQRARQYLELGFRIQRLLERWSAEPNARDRAPFLDSEYGSDLASGEYCLTGWNQRIRSWEDDPTCPAPEQARGQLAEQVSPLLRAVELGAAWRRGIAERRTGPALNQKIYAIPAESQDATAVNVHTDKACKNLLNHALALGLPPDESLPDEGQNPIVQAELDLAADPLFQFFWTFALEPSEQKALLEKLKTDSRSESMKLLAAMEPLMLAYAEAAAADPQLALRSEDIDQARKYKQELQELVDGRDGYAAVRKLKEMQALGLRVSPPESPREEALQVLSHMQDQETDRTDERLVRGRGRLTATLRSKASDDKALAEARDLFQGLETDPGASRVLGLLQRQVDPRAREAYAQRALESATQVLRNWEQRLEPLLAQRFRDALFALDDEGNPSLTDFGAQVWLVLTGQPIGQPSFEGRAILEWIHQNAAADRIMRNAIQELRRKLP